MAGDTIKNGIIYYHGGDAWCDNIYRIFQKGGGSKQWINKASHLQRFLDI